MLIREGWDRPVYAPETGAGAGTETGTDGGSAPPPAVDEGTGAESGAAEEGEQQQEAGA